MTDAVAEGYINLWHAIRDVDGEDDAWRKYWVEAPEMQGIWRLLDGKRARR